MKIQKFEGDYFEIGKQQGYIYKKRGMDLSKIIINKELYDKQLAIYGEYYPSLLEELKGVAEGLGEELEKVTYWFITNEIEYLKKLFGEGKACTIFSYKNKNSLYVGRNYDWVPGAEKIFEIYTCKPIGCNSFIAITDGAYKGEAGDKIEQLFYNVDDAINSKGLFIGLTFAYSDNWNYGLQCIHITKLIAETCETVEDAVKVFERIPVCSPKNYFIADKYENSIVVEHNSKEFKLVHPQNDVLIQTNHYVDSNLAKSDTVLRSVPYHNTFIRYFETLQKVNLRGKKFGYKDIIKVLGRKGSYTCQNFPGVKTIWSLSLDMAHQKYTLFYDLFRKRKSIKLKI